MAVNTASGCAIYIGTTADADSQSEFEADTYTLVGEVTNMGEFGRVYALITHSSLDDRNVRKFKGQRDDGTMTLIVGSDAQDAGQAALYDALDSDQDFNIKVEENDDTDESGATPTTSYFRAKIMSARKTIGDAQNVVTRRIDVAIQSGSIIEVAAS